MTDDDKQMVWLLTRGTKHDVYQWRTTSTVTHGQEVLLQAASYETESAMFIIDRLRGLLFRTDDSPTVCIAGMIDTEGLYDAVSAQIGFPKAAMTIEEAIREARAALEGGT